MTRIGPFPKTRKLSERLETISVDLTDREVEEQRALVCDLRDRQDALDEKLESIKADFKGKAKELEQAEGVARKLVSTRKKDIEVMVEEILMDGLDGISVQRVRADTGELLGDPRKATAKERQEPMFPSPDGGFGS